jgi:t-SNARE complex subunit (syntaxin)
MENTLKVVGHDSLVRDTSSQAIINTNTGEYIEYLARRTAREAEINQLKKQDEDITNLKSDISEIKQMLHLLIKDR